MGILTQLAEGADRVRPALTAGYLWVLAGVLTWRAPFMDSADTPGVEADLEAVWLDLSGVGQVAVVTAVALLIGELQVDLSWRLLRGKHGVNRSKAYRATLRGYNKDEYAEIIEQMAGDPTPQQVEAHIEQTDDVLSRSQRKLKQRLPLAPPVVALAVIAFARGAYGIGFAVLVCGLAVFGHVVLLVRTIDKELDGTRWEHYYP